MKSLSAQKGIAHIIPLFVIAVIAAAAIWFFQTNRGELEKTGTAVPIPPSQLMPIVSAREARTNICNLKKEGLFAEVCQEKFNTVGKDDSGKLAELFNLINRIQNDKGLSDYDRLFLGQLMFAVLPNKDSPQTSQSQSSLLGVAYAQEANNNLIMNEEEFKELMSSDLQGVVDSMPKGSNAWTTIVMVSKHSWVDGKRQPIYSKQWSKSFDPFPNNPNVNQQDIAYQISSIVGSRATSQTVYDGSFTGTGEMITYSFTMMSWKSQEYADGRGSTLDDFHLSQLNFSDEDYKGEDYLTQLIMSVKTPRPEVSTENSDKDEPKDEQTDQKSTDDIIDICETPERFCEAVEQCAKIGMSEGDRQLTYEERYAYCKKSNEGYFNDTCRLLVWLQESYNCPLEDNSCEARGKQAAAALKIPECKPKTR